MQFNNYRELTRHLVDAVVDALPENAKIDAERDYSNVSCSAYVNVTFWDLDEDGEQDDCVGGCKVRFSDHGDRYGSDLSIRFDGWLDCDELFNVELADSTIKEMVAEAVSFIEGELEDQVDD